MEASATAPRIPRRIRGALLDWFGRSGAPPAEVYGQLRMQAGFGDVADLLDFVGECYGEEAREALRNGAADDLDAAWQVNAGHAGAALSAATTSLARDHFMRQNRERYLLLHLPDPLFCTAVEAAISVQQGAYGEYGNPAPDAMGYVNTLFSENGVPYRVEAHVDGQYEVVWAGDEQVHETVVEPALAALADPRLATAAEDFGNALTDLRRGTRDALKDAVNDAVKALEGTMFAVIEARGLDPPERSQVWHLWEVLRNGRAVPQDMMEVLTAGSKVSNERGRHTDPRAVSAAEAEASVNAVAVAITYLASRLDEEWL